MNNDEVAAVMATAFTDQVQAEVLDYARTMLKDNDGDDEEPLPEEWVRMFEAGAHAGMAGTMVALHRRGWMNPPQSP